ncbi:MAG: trypsin-like peptidase domain-containing protein [Pirellulales bacterium]
MVRSAAASVALVALFALSAAGRDIELLDFTSPHCGPCQQMVPTIQNFLDAGYPITAVDVTRESQKAATYKVPRVPTLIMLVDGQVFERVEGATTGPRLEGMFQRAKAEFERRNQDRVRAQSPDRLRPTQAADQTAKAASPSVAWPGATRPSEPRPSEPWTGTADTRLTQARSESANSPTLNSQPSTLNPPDERLAKLVNASVRLRVDDANGHSYGTGTIIDARQGEALIVTCGHLFRDSKGEAPLTVEMFDATPTGVRSAGKVPGQVISYDLERDVALVAIHPGRPVSVAPIAPPRASIERGDRVASVGCSNGQDPTVLASRVTSLNRYQGPPNIETSGAPVEGRSGGGLFNQDGQLIGVCFAADKEGNEGLYAALKAIHDELNVRGLSDVCMQRVGNPPNTDTLADTRLSAAGPVIRGQDPGDVLAPRLPRPFAAKDEVVPKTVAINTPSPPPAGLKPAEQAAWEEIMSRAATSEVICIIRPKQPGGQSEVITLNDVSPEFVRALASRSQPSAPMTR